MHNNGSDSDSDSDSDTGSDIGAGDIPDFYIKFFDGKKIMEGNIRKTQGFGRPVKISQQLVSFINIPNGVYVPRPIITKIIAEYIKKYGLQNPTDRRKIELKTPEGERLRALLNVPNDVQLNFFNLQRYLSPHFISEPVKR